MIIEFKVSNYRSIKDQQTCSLVASTATELSGNTFIFDKDASLVRAAAIYGANASGKSNLLNALLFMRDFVLLSAKESQQGEKIPAQRFSFDEISRREPSEFEVSFVKNGVRYQYGFRVDENRIFEEWLFAYPFGRAQQWFSREYDKANEKYVWKFSKFFKNNKKITELTRGNVLFLSNAVKLNNEQLMPIFDFFQNDVIFIDSLNGRGLSLEKVIDFIKSEEGKLKVLNFMKAADPSILDIKIDVEEIPEMNFPSFFNPNHPGIQDRWKEIMAARNNFKIRFIHLGNILLDFEDESEGTRRLLNLAGCWIDALDSGRVLVIDELHSSLHPLVVKFLIQLICNPEINKKNAQLIFTTHDTAMLDNDLFRRDQIWFVEKDEANSTQIYPLLDFSPRKNEAIGKGYLQGRYGALPYIGEYKF